MSSKRTAAASIGSPSGRKKDLNEGMLLIAYIWSYIEGEGVTTPKIWRRYHDLMRRGSQIASDLK